MSIRVCGSVLVLAGLLMAACDGGEAVMDGGVDGRAPDVDGGSADSGPADGGSLDGGADGGPILCGESVCTAEEACVRGVCVAHCGGDASGWDEALAAGLTPLASFCRSAAVRTTHVEGAAVEVWDLTTSSAGTTTTFVLSRWAATASMPAVAEVTRTSRDTGSDEVLLFEGGYVALSPDAASAAFGYTTTAAGALGGIFHVLTADGASLEVEAPGNFDATWLDGSTLLVNGYGLDGEGGEQGLYAAVFTAEGLDVVRVAAGLGIASGGVRVTDTHVLVGGFFEGFEARTYVIARDLVEEVIAGTREMIDVEAAAGTKAGTPGIHRVAALPSTSTFEVVEDLVVVQDYDEEYNLAGLRAHSVVSYERASGLDLAEGEALTTGGAFRGALPAGTGRMMLVFDRGLLLVQR